MRVRLIRRIRAKRPTQTEWFQVKAWVEIEVCGKGSRDGSMTIIEHPRLGHLVVRSDDLAEAIELPKNDA